MFLRSAGGTRQNLMLFLERSIFYILLSERFERGFVRRKGISSKPGSLIAGLLTVCLFLLLGSPLPVTGTSSVVGGWRESDRSIEELQRGEGLAALRNPNAKIDIEARLARLPKDWSPGRSRVLDQFSVKLDFSQLAKLVSLQGAANVYSRLLELGLSPQRISAICLTDQEQTSELDIAEQLLVLSGASLDRRPILQLLAAGCISSYLSKHPNAVQLAQNRT